MKNKVEKSNEGEVKMSVLAEEKVLIDNKEDFEYDCINKWF